MTTTITKQNNSPSAPLRAPIKPGYKKTPIGMIPEDWEVEFFGSIALRKSERFNPKEEANTKDLELDSFEQKTGRIIRVYDSEDYKSSKNSFKKGDVLFGKLRPYLRKFWKAEFDGVCSSEIWVFKNKKQLVKADYLFLILQSKYFIRKAEITSGTKMPRSVWDLVKNARIPIPPKQEQKSIAACLSTWNQGIDKLTQFLQAKKQQKKGLMQQLLTGSLRLRSASGEKFDGEWKEVRLEEVVDIKKGKTITSSKAIDGEYQVIAGGKTSPYSHNNWNYEDVVTVSASGAYAGYVQYFDEKIWASDCSVVKPKNDESDVKYIYALLKLFQEKIYLQQSGGAQPHVYPQDLNKMLFKIPSKEEQTAIAEILQTADQEIELLEQKLSSFQQQKKGLMQVLLTGEKRLI